MDTDEALEYVRTHHHAVLAYGAVVVAANRDWRTSGDDSVEAMLGAFDAYAEQFTPAVFEHWT